VDVIFVGTSTTAGAVRQATRAIPIVMGYSVDPVGDDLVASLARHGGNVTGMASAGKNPSYQQLELLKAIVPGLSRVALVRNPESANYVEDLARAEEAAQKFGVTLVAVDARDVDDAAAAFVAIGNEGVQAVMVVADPRQDGRLPAQQERIAELALEHGLPSASSQREFARAGGLFGCGEDLNDFYRRAASFVDKIFMGAKPADLPIEQPAKLYLTINRKTAAALKLRIPPRLAADADELFD
jgi:putative ABC transport system substrate-binding protein